MWNTLSALQHNLLRHAEAFVQPKRSVFILRRKNTPKLSSLGSSTMKKLRRKHFYYELVEDTNVKRKPPLDLILTSDVAGVGMTGDKIKMNVYIAYRDLLLPKLAVYADSPEAKNLKITEAKQFSSIYTKVVENYLASQPVKIFLSHDIEWTLKPWHVKLALRKNNIFTKEECITIPREIKGPNLEIENKDFIVKLTMNKSEVFSLRCRIYHWSTLDSTLNQKSTDINSPSCALFEDEQEAINAIIKTEQEIKIRNMIQGGRPATDVKTKFLRLQ